MNNVESAGRPSRAVWSRVLLALAAGAIVGWAIFALLAWRAVTVLHVPADDALRRFHEVRSAFGSAAPVLEIAADGTIVRREPSRTATTRLALLTVLTYQPGEQRLVRAEVPFWFFRLKAPAADYALRGTGVSFRNLGITSRDLEGYGPALILDHTTAAGNRVIVWTE